MALRPAKSEVCHRVLDEDRLDSGLTPTKDGISCELQGTATAENGQLLVQHWYFAEGDPVGTYSVTVWIDGKKFGTNHFEVRADCSNPAR
jgi:hypothetical protein